MDKKIRIKKENVSCINNALCLMEFSNACLKKTQKSVNFELYRASATSERNRRILTASTSRLKYSGTNYQTNNFNIVSSVLKVAVLNKKAQKFKLYDVDYFVLKPMLKCEISADTEIISKTKQNQNLTLQFGGKTKARGLTSSLKFQSEKTDETLLKKISEIQTVPPDIKPSTVVSETDDIIPVANKNASSPAEVYNIFDIIPREIYSALESEIGIFNNITYETLKTWKNESKFSPFVIHYLEMNILNVTSDNAKLLCYINYLMTFVQANYRDVRKKDAFSEIPQPYRGSLMKTYVMDKTFSQRMKDKLLANLIILCLHLNHFVVDGMLLASSTKIGIKRLINLAYALGCYVNSSKGDTTKSFELKLPLYKLDPLRAKRRFR